MQHHSALQKDEVLIMLRCRRTLRTLSKGKKPDTGGQILHNSTFRKYPEQADHQDTKQVVVAGGKESWGSGVSSER